MFLWIDTEANGLFDYTVPAHAPSQPHLCSIGMIFADHEFNITAEHEWLIKPYGWRLDPDSEAAKVNGLTQEELVEKGVPIKHILPIYVQAIEERKLIGGHNISHDLKLLRGELRRAEMPDLFMQTRSICTMKGSRNIVGALDKRGRTKMPRLEEACAYFGIPMSDKHRALADAKCSLEIMRKLREMGHEPTFDDPYVKQRAKGGKGRAGPLDVPAIEMPVDEKDMEI